ncbi:type I-F CRISPR-associated helicase Cas3f [Oceanimonas smirnovii]|uniref:type I-F CRISPR-associated helicase Cas3f n=1 Tax=Oceanimonas smirnovii TaxID=264574 RepID=UPI00376F8E78
MMVIFVSQCEKKALPRTRRVLDAFANRIGDNTWQTLITEEGLQTVNKMLRKTASKSTAVSCHWIRSRARSQLLWIVGNKKKFNAEGVVAVNSTEQDLLVRERFALHTEVIANLSAIAGFFHDIGKANQLFQCKLDIHTKGPISEPLRHEWISLRLFQAFVGQHTDQQWLSKLANIDNSAESELLETLLSYRDLLTKDIPCPLTHLPPIASTVAWLIVSHHKLPQYPFGLDNPPDLSAINQWQSIFEPCWNSPKVTSEQWSEADVSKNWTFPVGTPFKSAFWQNHVSRLAKQVLNCQVFFEPEWQNNLSTRHLARLSLMLADHAESSRQDVDNNLSDRNYRAYANTDVDEHGRRYQKQKLDEHNIRVGEWAYKIARDLPGLRGNLKKLDRIKALEKPVSAKFKSEFGWQDKSAKLASIIKDQTKKCGFFGISMASTGKGKTRANAKIMYALSDEGQCRFNVALGLRTLSIQTANALKKDLFDSDDASQKLANKNIALLVGSQAVRDLQQVSLADDSSIDADHGSQSKESLLKDEVELLDGFDTELLEQIPWCKHDPKIRRLLHAPVLVSTIDYLIPATEGVRGGRQIAPMLRLLTSDLVLDEPDDFGLDDLPALCRLVNWAGMLGSRVLLSTATISPSFATSLFDAYQSGRKHFVQANGGQDEENKICCAWFDECNKPREKLARDSKEFTLEHNYFVAKRVDKLTKKQVLRKGKLVDLNTASASTPSMAFSQRIYQSMAELHSQHSVLLGDKSVSIGLVRMANINPLVNISQKLLETPAPENTQIHYCIYHSQYPLLQRTSIEKMLDRALKRHKEEEWQENSGIRDVIEQSDSQHHIFVVLATSVAEVGRDHDYDWAIVEPSSLRSIIQLAGRIQRHRMQPPNQENIHILAQNYKALKGKAPCFEKPGFETKHLRYSSSDLRALKVDTDLEAINAAPRVLYKPSQPNGRPDLTADRQFNKFSELEHFAQTIKLKGSPKQNNHAAHWWQSDVTWCGEMQRLQPFRRSRNSGDYCLSLTRENKLIWQKKSQGVYPTEYLNTSDIKIPREALNLGAGVNIWHEFDLQLEIKHLAEEFGKTGRETLQTYTHLELEELDNNEVQWQYQPELGVYKMLIKDEYGDGE